MPEHPGSPGSTDACLLFWKQRVARHGIYLQALAAYSPSIMKHALVLTFAILGSTATIAWAGSLPASPSAPSTSSHPPLQCACVIGNPAA